MCFVPWAVCRGVWLFPIACRYDKCWSKHGNLIPHCACWQWVECLPLACCCKNVFRETGVRVDTVALSLFLASIRNLLAGGGKWLIGWQRPRKRDLLPPRKKAPLATAVMWHQRCYKPFVAWFILPHPGIAGNVMSSPNLSAVFSHPKLSLVMAACILARIKSRISLLL